MIDDTKLKELLHNRGVTKRDKVLALIAAEGGKGVSAKELKARAAAAGLRAVKKWDISTTLRNGGGASFTDAGWELVRPGRERLEQLVGPLGGPARKAAIDLRSVAAGISSSEVLAFVTEAIACLEARLLRAAVVLSWVGAVSQLYQYVIAEELPNFNVEASRRDSRWRPAKSVDDLARMKELDFLNVLEAISVIGKSVKQTLLHSLTLRNGCGHPNSLSLGESAVAYHIEGLILNVFTKY
jgi:hypothetical protein